MYFLYGTENYKAMFETKHRKENIQILTAVTQSLFQICYVMLCYINDIYCIYIYVHYYYYGSVTFWYIVIL